MLLQIIATLIFLATAGYTIHATATMSGGMEMPGGWTMSMMWMTMPGQTLAGAAAMFIAMWAAMMVAMMLPSAMPMLLVYRRVVTFHKLPHPALHVAVMASGYFAVWTLFGAIVWGVGMGLAHLEMSSDRLSRAIPIAAGATLILSGLYQFTPWKSSCLNHCRDPIGAVAGHFHHGLPGAAHLGLPHGFFCTACCWSLMLIQIVLGLMNLWVMAAIAVVIALEKMIPRGIAVARIAGGAAVAMGIYLIIRRI